MSMFGKQASPHERAVAYFRWLLAAATITSVAGNVTHALMNPASSHTWVAVVVATIAPLMLFGTVHGIALAVRAGVRGASYVTALVAVAGIATTAFVFSFAALRDLAAMLGYGERLSALLPVIIDATVAVTTLMLMVLDKPATSAVAAATAQPTTADDTPAVVAPTTSQPPFTYPLLDPDRHRFALTATADIPVIMVDDMVVDEPPTTTNAVVDEAVAAADLLVDDHQPTPTNMVVADPTVVADVVDDAVDDHQPTTDSVVVADQRAVADKPAAAAVPAPANLRLVPSDDHRAAALAVADRGVVKASADQIEQVLAGLADGMSQRKIAEAVGVDRSTVSRIKSTAAELIAA